MRVQPDAEQGRDPKSMFFMEEKGSVGQDGAKARSKMAGFESDGGDLAITGCTSIDDLTYGFGAAGSASRLGP